jgi:hypothetical protein
MLDFKPFHSTCPDCDRPEAIKRTCWHCGSEYPAEAPVASSLLTMELTIVLATVAVRLCCTVAALG